VDEVLGQWIVVPGAQISTFCGGAVGQSLGPSLDCAARMQN
jgi:hypothetical protein